MSSFSSVVRKPGTAIKPRAPPRRNIARKPQAAPTPGFTLTPESQQDDPEARDDGAIQSLESVQAGDIVNFGVTPPSTLPESNEQSTTALEGIGEPSTNPVTERSPSQTQLNIPPRVSDTAKQGNEVATAVRAYDAPSPRGQKRKVVEPMSIVEQVGEYTESEEETVDSRPIESITITSEAQHVESQPSTSHKKRKTTPRESPTAALPQSRHRESPSTQPVVGSASSRRNSSHSQPSDDLLQSATERAASVSEMARNIDRRTRAHSVQTDVDADGHIISSESGEPGTSTRPTSGRRSNRQKKSATEQAAEVVANAVGQSRNQTRKRDVTPENAEDYQLKADEVTMGELVRDRKVGKKSQLEEDMQRDWVQIVERRKEAQARALEFAQHRRKKAFGSSSIANITMVDVPAVVPVMSVGANGRIVINDDARHIDRAAALEQTAIQDATDVREDKPYFKRINQSTVGMKVSAARKFRWDEQSTEKFFECVQMFGTDFLMIANMFPGLDRKQLKKKFIREENADRERMKRLLATRIPVDQTEYSKVTNTELLDPKDVQATLEAEEQRLREEDHQRRVREGFASAKDVDEPVPSTEGGNEQEADGSVQNESRFSEIARDIMAPKQRQRQTSSSVRKRGPKASRRPAEGVEEVLGHIDEVRV